jgi:di/tricarboxylate transporter
MAPDWISIVLANMLAASAAILYFQGVRLFCGLRVYAWPEYVAGVFAISAVIYFRYFTNNIDFRTFALSLLMGSFGLANGITLLRAAPAGRGFSTFFTGIVFLLAGTAHLSRGIYAYTFTPATELFAPSAVNAVFFVLASLGVVCWSFGFILMTGERQTRVVTEGIGRLGAGRAIPEAEVWQQVHRIITSEGFRRSARMERFLTLAVERTLMGHPEDLKEYSLGRDVFNRGEQYDPRQDSIVRVEAQRLRRKLREYYDSCGKNDPIIVEFHAGSYVPTFRHTRSNEMRLTMSKAAPGRY